MCRIKLNDLYFYFLAWMLIVLVVLGYVTGSFGFWVLFLVVASFCSLHYLFDSVATKKKVSVEIFLILVCVLFSLASIRYSSLGGVFVALNFLTSAIFAKSLASRFRRNSVNHDEVILRISQVSYYCFLFFLIYRFYDVGFNKYGANDIFAESSRNMVSGVLIFLQCFYSAARYFKDKKIVVFSPFLTLAVAVVCFGRSGIAVSFLIASCTVFFAISRFSMLSRFCFLAVGFSAIFYLGNSLWPFSVDLIESTNFTKGLESVRSDINYQYISSMGIVELFFGSPYSLSPVLVFFDENPHNSFIHGHHFMGLGYLIFVCYLLVRLVSCIFKLA